MTLSSCTGIRVRNRSRMRPLYIGAILVLIVSGILTPAIVRGGQVHAAVPGPITYAYDGAGRLTGVIDPNQAAGVYHYDAAGNIASITHQSTSAVSILAFGPTFGPVGTSVTITGTGFSATTSSDVVKFNGTVATVATATTTQLVATVPSGATSGAISVAVAGGTPVSSTRSFTVGSSVLPVVSSVSTRIATSGTTFSIGGSHFGSTSATNVVRINGTVAKLQTVTATSITATVPPDTGSGTLTVTTPAGTVTSGSFFVPPSTYTSSQVGVTGTIASGTAKTVSFADSSHIALLMFNGVRGQRVSVSSSAGSSGAYGSVTLLDPNNGTVPQPIGGGSGFGNGDFFDAVTLPLTGTYTLLLDPYGAGSVSLTLHQFSDLYGSITAGTALAASITIPGQNYYLRFTGTTGQKVSLVGGSSALSNYTVSIVSPYGAQLASTTGTSYNSSFIDATPLPYSGTYTVLLDPYGAATGSTTLTLYTVTDFAGTISPDGPTLSVPITTPGQNAYIAFSGSAGDTAAFQWTNSTIAQGEATVLGPDGNQVTGFSFGSGTGTFGPFSVPASGTYKLELDPSGADTGSLTLAMAGGSQRPQPAYASATFNVQRSRLGGRGMPGPNLAHWAKGTLPSRARTGLTTLLGRVLGLPGAPLAHVSVSIGARHTYTDAAGHFVLTHLAVGHHVLLVDGHPADRRGATYGIFEIRVDVRPLAMNVLPYVIWMPRIDTAHAVAIAAPTRHRVVLTTPRIPGLKIIIPRGVILRDRLGHVVHWLSITPIPTSRPPFPFPHGYPFPVYFTLQPGDAVASPGALRVIYPNVTHARPGTRMPFWSYDPASAGWWVYGFGSVSRNGESVVPDKGVRFASFSGAGNPTDDGPPPSGPDQIGDDVFDVELGDLPTPGWILNPGCPFCGDPVDAGTGLGVVRQTDLVLPDVMPIVVSRVYRQGDNAARFFGYGQQLNYGLLLRPVITNQEAELILPDGGHVRYTRISPGTGHDDAVYRNASSPGMFYGSTVRWNGSGWDLRLTDGTVYSFTDFNASGENAVLLDIRDRAGNETSIMWDTNHEQILAVKSPNGRWVQFSYDSSGTLINQVSDDLGRTVTYAYDTSGNLTSVTDVNGGVTKFVYYSYSSSSPCASTATGSNGNLCTITDARGRTFVTDIYDSNGRVSQQTLGDGTTYKFAYTTDFAGHVTQTSVTNPRGYVRQLTFNTAGYPVRDIFAVGTGTSTQQTYSFARQTGTNLLLSETDPLGRTTSYTYDANGNATTVTRLAGTSNAETDTYTYNAYAEPTSATDPLSHKTTFTYDAYGNLISVIDPLGHTWTYTYNGEGEPATMKDPLGNTTTLAYTFGDLTSIKDPLNHMSTQFVDAGGRTTSMTDALGYTTTVTYDNRDDPITVADPLGGTVTMAYDADGNQLSVQDPRGGTTYFTFDAMDRLCGSFDPLDGLTSPPTSCPTATNGHVTVYAHDGNGNLTKGIDRDNHTTTYVYDALDRLSKVTYADGSTITDTYDAGNRLTKSVDSVGGTIADTYDGLDRLTNETTPQGSVGYTYDKADRRYTMTVAGQPTVTYGYDNANRLTSITQGTGTVSGCNGSSTAVSVCLTYNNANLETSLTLPNAVQQLYGYDAADELTGITYAKGTGSTSCNGYSVGACLGYITYGYDQDGQRTTAGGPWARTSIPAIVGSATYNADNELTSWAGKTLTYDNGGNLTGDGSNTYTWNARNQLSSVTIIASGTKSSFGYDAFGRRISRTVGSATTGYLYDGLNVVQELSGTTPTANELTGPGIDQTFMRTDSTGSSSLLTDGLGSTVALTNSSGTVTTQYTYDPFGNTTVSGTSSTNHAQYAGMQNDGGLYFDNARYYNPAQARFISQDPLGFGGGDADLYRYVGDQPTIYTDPLGLDGPKLSQIIFATATGVALVAVGALRCPAPQSKLVFVGAGAGAIVLTGVGILAAIAEKSSNAKADTTGTFQRKTSQLTGQPLNAPPRSYINSDNTTINQQEPGALIRDFTGAREESPQVLSPNTTLTGQQIEQLKRQGRSY